MVATNVLSEGCGAFSYGAVAQARQAESIRAMARSHIPKTDLDLSDAIAVGVRVALQRAGLKPEDGTGTNEFGWEPRHLWERIQCSTGLGRAKKTRKATPSNAGPTRVRASA